MIEAETKTKEKPVHAGYPTELATHTKHMPEFVSMSLMSCDRCERELMSAITRANWMETTQGFYALSEKDAMRIMRAAGLKV